MTFEGWMAQRYSAEYSSGEYRDHDMQAAYNAGRSTRDCADCDNQLYTIGCAEGVQAERERCARIAKDEQMRYTSCNS